MNAQQMLHQRYKVGLQQMLADTSKKRTKAQRAALEAKLAEALEYERQNAWIVA